MKQSSVQIDRKNKTVPVVMPLEKPRPSKSTGKTLVIATTGGLKTSGESYARRPVCFTANAFFYPTSPMRRAERDASAAEGAVPRSTMKSRDRRRDRTTGDGSEEK